MSRPASRFAATAAAAEPVAGLDVTWRQLLFDDDGALAAPDDPAQALLAATDGLLTGLREHTATLPERARLHWLEHTLGIPRLPGLPDEVVAVATADPSPVPPVLPRGTALRAARGGDVPERTYLTTDALTVLGARVTGVHGYRADGDTDRTHVWTGTRPFAPFEGPPALHVLDVVTDVVAFAGGDGTATLRCSTAAAPVLAAASWQYSTPDGLRTTTPTRSGDTLVLQLRGGCGPHDLGGGELRTFLRATFLGDALPAAALDTAFTTLEVSLTRADVAPDAAFAGAGKVDVSVPFQPFGPVPRRGDVFSVRCDEAFGKQLASLTVELETPAATGGSGGRSGDAGGGTPRAAGSGAGSPLLGRPADTVGTAVSKAGTVVVGVRDGPPAPRLEWQRRSAGRWVRLDDVPRLEGLRTSSGASGPLSQADDPRTGHVLRLVLVQGDLGWSAHLRRVARFAAAAADPERTPDPADLAQPEPPTVTAVRIGYTTAPLPVTDLRTRNGPAVRSLPTTGIRRPFTQLVADAGAVLVGLDVAAAHLGSVLSCFVELTQAPACGSAGREHDASWECWTTAGAWRRVDVLDGTRGLRQSGLVRIVTPGDWADGCPDAGAPTGRWLRLVTTTPQHVGALLSLHADAVAARWAGGSGDPLVPLVPGQVKGLRTPVRGVRVTNPVAGTVGRAPEPDAGYRARASEVVRTRGRALQAWDYERLVEAHFPEVAVVRCLPHTDADGCSEPGAVGLVVLPRSPARTPFPSVGLADRIVAVLRPLAPLHARVVVLCPDYVPVRLRAQVLLRRDVAAAEARVRVLAALERELHPLSGVEGAPFGRALYPSSLVAFLERLPDVDHVEDFALLAPHTTGDVVPVDACRGLIASGGDHQLALRETL